MSIDPEHLRIITEHNQRIKSELFKPAQGILRWPYLSAGTGNSYPDLTDWDTIWSGIGYLLAGDAEPLRCSMFNLLDHILPDGKGQRRIGFAKYSAPPYQIRPFLACGAWALTHKIGTDWLSTEHLDKLHANLLWWHNHRIGREGLLRWLHVDEGFADNGLCNWCWEGNAVQAVDLNAQIVREHIALARVFERVGDGYRATQHQEFAKRLAYRINASLWHQDDGCYYSLYNPPARHDQSSFITTRGYNNLWPLWVGITPDDRAHRIIETWLLNPKGFLSPFGIRSMSQDERFYNNLHSGLTSPMPSAPNTGPVMHSWCSNWQGPIWPVSTWLGVRALLRYGYRAEAEELAGRFCEHIASRLQIDGHYYENYHAETGEPLKAKGIGSWYVLLPHILDDNEDDIFPSLTKE